MSVAMASDTIVMPLSLRSKEIARVEDQVQPCGLADVSEGFLIELRLVRLSLPFYHALPTPVNK